METILIFIYLTTGEIYKVPISLELGQTCNEKLMEIVKDNEEGNGVLYRGSQVALHYCKTTKGEWIK